MSNYGVQLGTVVPYSLAYLGCARCSVRAARAVIVRDRRSQFLRLVLSAFSVVLVLILVSTYTYKIDVVFDDLHVGVNIAAGAFETLASLWMFLAFGAKSSFGIWLGLELCGVILAVLTASNLVHLIFMAECAMAGGFGLVLIGATRANLPLASKTARSQRSVQRYRSR